MLSSGRNRPAAGAATLFLDSSGQSNAAAALSKKTRCMGMLVEADCFHKKSTQVVARLLAGLQGTMVGGMVLVSCASLAKSKLIVPTATSEKRECIQNKNANSLVEL